jgi:hypothetical protein
MTTLPEALRLADALDYDPMPMGWYLEAAAELRRQHDAIQDLLEALKSIAKDQTPWGNQAANMAETARAAIAKHSKGNT